MIEKSGDPEIHYMEQSMLLELVFLGKDFKRPPMSQQWELILIAYFIH
jgi:hypothetical protein